MSCKGLTTGLCRATRRMMMKNVQLANVRLASSSVNFTKKPSPYAHGKHRSSAEGLINKVPVIECDDNVAVCDGGSGALGHPVEYIQLNTVSHEPAVCKYCGLRYKMKHHHH